VLGGRPRTVRRPGRSAIGPAIDSRVLGSGTDGSGRSYARIDPARHDTLVSTCRQCVVTRRRVVQAPSRGFFWTFCDRQHLTSMWPPRSACLSRSASRRFRAAGFALVRRDGGTARAWYHGGDYDLAGSAVGIVEKDSILDGSITGSVLYRCWGWSVLWTRFDGFSMIRKILRWGRPAISRLRSMVFLWWIVACPRPAIYVQAAAEAHRGPARTTDFRTSRRRAHRQQPPVPSS